ncbi:MAG: vWA domain-containing protein [Chloroflexota bacterium]
MPTQKKTPLCILLLILLLILAACGGAGEPAEEAPAPEEAPVAEEEVLEEEEAMEEEEMEEEAAEDTLEEALGDLEATGSERDGGQLPPPGTIKVAEPRERTDDLDDNNGTNQPRAETASSEPLTAGEVDDNAAWTAYLSYLNSYTATDVLAVDVSQRRQIAVRDMAGDPILDAQLTILANNQIVTTLATHSDGTALFFPRAYPTQSASYTVRAVANGVISSVPLANVGATTITLSRGNTAPAQLDLVILLDATGSMGDEIAQLKANIDQIASDVALLAAQPDTRMALIAYRDEGDSAFVTRTLDFVSNVADFTAFLDGIEARGGGDYPEALDVALAEAMQGLSWRTTPTVQLAFVVADAPPHVEVTASNNYAFSMQQAAEQGIKIFPIASSGLDAQGEYIFRQLAQFTNGRFLFLIDPPGQTDTTNSNNFAVNNFTITALDDLIVDIIADELSHLP